MDAEVEDMHVCLKCNSCIVGLENYVLHRKNECTSLPTTPTKASTSKEGTNLQVNTTSSSPISPSSAAAAAKLRLAQSPHQPDDAKLTPPQMSKDLQQQKPSLSPSNSKVNEQPGGTEESFTCPGCEHQFEVEFAFLAHIRVCVHIAWPNENEESVSNDDTTAEVAKEQEQKEDEIQKYGADMDFRNIQPDGNLHCILCNFVTEFEHLMASHVKGKMHAEFVHEQVARKLGKQFNFFKRNKDNMLTCEPCGWQTDLRLDMESHICNRLHHETIINIIMPGYSVFGKGAVDNPEKQPKGILDIQGLEGYRIMSSQELGKRIINESKRQYWEDVPKNKVVLAIKHDKRSSRDQGDEVDKLVKESMIRHPDLMYTCQICSYSTEREYDMKAHLDRKKHNQNVVLLKQQLAVNGTINLSAVVKSKQYVMENKKGTAGEQSESIDNESSTNEQQQDESAETLQGGSSDNVIDDSIPDDQSDVKQGRSSDNVIDYSIPDDKSDVNSELESSTQIVTRQSSTSDAVNQEAEVTPARRSTRKRKANVKYTVDHDLSADEESADSFEGEPVKKKSVKKLDELANFKKEKESSENLPAKRRGRPKKLSVTQTKKRQSNLFSSLEYSCEICDYEFNSANNLREHFKNKDHKKCYERFKLKDALLIECQECPAAFLSNTNYELHMEWHNNRWSDKYKVNMFKCEACIFAFVSEDALMVHKENNCKGGQDDDKTCSNQADDVDTVQDSIGEGQDKEDVGEDDGNIVQENSTQDNTDQLHKQNDTSRDVEQSCDNLQGESGDGNKKQKRHKKRRVPKHIFACEVCNYTNKTVKGLLGHFDSMSHEEKMCEASGEEKTFQCHLCYIKFHTIRLLDVHLEKHVQTNQEFKICAFCNERMLRDKYKEHCEKAGHKDLVQPETVGFKCNICGKVMRTSNSLADHKYIHTGQRPHKCPMCPFRSRRKGDIPIHIKRHLGIRAFKCDQCDATFVKKSALNRHQGTHLGKDRPRDIKCDLCDATFFNHVTLRIHHKNVHEEVEPRFFCEVEGCTHGSRSKSALKTHMRSHSKDRPFLCTTCGTTTASQKAMTIHQRLHTGDKPFKCTYEGCSYAARFDSHLRRHILVHTGAKPYKCPHCDYRTNVQENLRKHVKNSRKHKGMKMYKCTRCNEWQGDTLKELINHIRLDHGVYVKRLQVANETGIFQKDVLMASLHPESEETVGGESSNVVEETASRESNELDIANMPLMQGDTQSELPYEQAGNQELGIEEQDVVEEHRDMINPTLVAQARTQQLVVKLEERVGDIFNSLMAGGLG